MTRSERTFYVTTGGFDTKPLFTMRYYMPNEIYTTPELKVQRTEDVMRRVEALPGVQAAFASNLVPLSGGGGFTRILIDGRPSEKGKEPGIGFTALIGIPGLVLSWYTGVRYLPQIRRSVAVGRARRAAGSA